MLFYTKTVFIGIFSLLLTACDSSEYSAPNSGTSIEGVVVDGYLDKATICLDVNKNLFCDDNESMAKSDENGKFTLHNIVLEPNNLVPIIAYGGKDTATDKAFIGQIKNIINTSMLNETIIISPVTDLVANMFLNSDENISIEEVKIAVSNILGIELVNIDKDPFDSKILFTKSQEVQHAKYLLETVMEKNLKNITADELLVLQENIKEQLLELDFDIARSLGIVSLNHQTSIPVNEITFVVQQFDELKNALNNASEDMILNSKNLNSLQKSIDEQQTVAINKLIDSNSTDTIEIVKISTADISMTKNLFKTENAIFDEQACLETNGYISLASLKTVVTNKLNGISSLESQKEDVTTTLYFPSFNASLTAENKGVYHENYHLIFDTGWIENDNNIVYIQTSSSSENICEKLELNSKIPEQGIEVYRDTEI